MWTVALVHALVVTFHGVTWMMPLVLLFALVWGFVQVRTTWAKRQLRATGAIEQMHALWPRLFMQMVHEQGYKVNDGLLYSPHIGDTPQEERGYAFAYQSKDHQVLVIGDTPALQRASWAARRIARDASVPSVWGKRAYARIEQREPVKDMDIPGLSSHSAHERLRIQAILQRHQDSTHPMTLADHNTAAGV